MLALLVGCLLTAPAQAADKFEFRNDDRPVHGKSVTVEELKTAHTVSKVTILDVRLREDFDADPQLIPDALYKDPDNIESWASSIPDDGKVIVYCVRGKWVSHKAASYLSDRGLDVYTLEGGIEAWKITVEK